MPSLEGFKTWLDYELLITGVVLVLVVLWRSADLLVAYLRSLALGTTEFALYLVGFCLAGVVLMIRLAGRSRR